MLSGVCVGFYCGKNYAFHLYLTMGPHSHDARVAAWLTALDERYLADLTPQEVARALRALSSCYVERRGKLAAGGALEGAGKRAAFALFYAPLHLFIVRQILRELPLADRRLRDLYDLGCGTGTAGAAWALDAPSGVRILGADKHPWAVAEANWTYGQLGLPGRAVRQDLTKVRFTPGPATGILAAYSVNELTADARAALLRRLLDAKHQGAAVLILEPISRRTTPWWDAWAAAFKGAGGREDDWRFTVELPARQRLLAKAAGLHLQELTARSLCLYA
jgi:hypothetical protein